VFSGRVYRSYIFLLSDIFVLGSWFFALCSFVFVLGSWFQPSKIQIRFHIIRDIVKNIISPQCDELYIGL
ncbi:MAG TPA: hypothetical protein PKL64_07650, partial [Bacteroidales bacterium]|nr:hypothetical protein [Bacteroidales bacterium]